MATQGRLFTFGCSFTSYLWPTWADIINFDLDNQFYNWGVRGIGNVAILYKMLECDLKYKFNSDDIILVTWSSWNREDRLYPNGEWMIGGNIFNNKDYDDTFVHKYWNEHNDIVKNASAIIIANKMFNINFQSHMTDFDSYMEKLNNKHKHLLDNLPDAVIFDTTDNSRFNNRTWDSHPDIICHLNHTNTVYKSLNLTIKPSTVDHYTKLQDYISNELADTDMNMSWDEKVKFFEEILT
jgi:hypothetical protein